MIDIWCMKFINQENSTPERKWTEALTNQISKVNGQKVQKNVWHYYNQMTNGLDKQE